MRPGSLTESVFRDPDSKPKYTLLDDFVSVDFPDLSPIKTLFILFVSVNFPVSFPIANELFCVFKCNAFVTSDVFDPLGLTL